MNWVTENKFVAGLLVVVLLGAAALGFLLMQAKGNFTETSETFEAQAAELSRLQNLKPYPEQANLDKLNQQKDAFVSEVNALRQKLAAAESPIAPMSPEEFQDKLRSTVTGVQEIAKEQGVELPEGFYLGFPEYQASPPHGELTARLGWQLASISSVVRSIIQNRVTSIDSLSRELLPGETGGPPVPAAAPGKPNPRELVERFPFVVEFTGEQSRLKTTLNQLANTKEQFLIVESLKIENEMQTGPEKSLATAFAGTGAASQADVTGQELDGALATANSITAPAMLSFITGTEKVKARLRISILDFDAPAGEASTHKEAVR